MCHYYVVDSFILTSFIHVKTTAHSNFFFFSYIDMSKKKNAVLWYTYNTQKKKPATDGSNSRCASLLFFSFCLSEMILQ